MQGAILTPLCLLACLTNQVSPAQQSYGVPTDHGSPGYSQPFPSHSYYQPPIYRPGYGSAPPYGPQYGHHHYFRPHQPRLIDRDVCDLDASVLLVASSRRHHYHDGRQLNRAHRVRCSVIASHDEESCNVCCQHAARRDNYLMNNQLVGFLVVTKDLEPWDVEDHDDQDSNQSKDVSENQSDEEENQSDESEKIPRRKRSYNHEANTDDTVKLPEIPFMPQPYYNNVKCVCCAPRRSLYHIIHLQFTHPTILPSYPSPITHPTLPLRNHTATHPLHPLRILHPLHPLHHLHHHPFTSRASNNHKPRQAVLDKQSKN
ncbi:hypothetical protein KIN20_037265 [Parelaphostrongylus tenuis]|uniref:Uncharacterized protein n=1 Tax=Parelaphostrongylus tenuis TaxID=148309 RepID=A0AAD5WL63_PARTN|nr:hypothetical protein KIN20_037265 [Parelaphostrongylus tenuis]